MPVFKHFVFFMLSSLFCLVLCGYDTSIVRMCSGMNIIVQVIEPTLLVFTGHGRDDPRVPE